MKIILHLIVFLALTIITQIGGVIYLLSLGLVRRTSKKQLKRTVLFIALYGLSVFFIVPKTASFFGRVPIEDTANLKAHSVFYKLTFRNYVTPELNTLLVEVSGNLNAIDKNLKLVYLDANFPFLDGFPLLPHLSHNDGKKVDLSFVYSTKNGEILNLKKSISGYGVFEQPSSKEFNQTEQCKKNGYWFYDFPKYLTFGEVNKDLQFSEKANRDLVNLILKQPHLGKLFIEPHLKQRLNLNHSKVRFHGCHAVRHDDHIHIQL